MLEMCLKSISMQNYPKEQLEIILGDGGSTDGTIEIAQKYNAQIIHNPLKTAESGKMIALRAATGDFVALIDSDNELVDNNWLQNMVNPLIENPTAVGSEPWEYTWRRSDGLVTRYCALIGMNDPLVHFLGSYDRLNGITGKWTGLDLNQQDKGSYILVKLAGDVIPTIGANGTVFRTSFLKENATGNYLFDIDILNAYIQKFKEVDFIKVKTGIIHSYCESNIPKFALKQRRRVKDFLFHRHKGSRVTSWGKQNMFGYLYFILSCITILPLVIQSLIGYFRKKDPAWFFHILACEITLWEYTLGFIKSIFKKEEQDRSTWKQ